MPAGIPDAKVGPQSATRSIPNAVGSQAGPQPDTPSAKLELAEKPTATNNKNLGNSTSGHNSQHVLGSPSKG